MYICIDFDGTIVKHEYPAIGAPVPGAIEKMKEWQKQGHHLILYTMRSNSKQSGPRLQEAVNYVVSHGIFLYGVNVNYSQSSWTSSPKVYGHVYVDDAAYGCPLIHPTNGERPYVDWSKVHI